MTDLLAGTARPRWARQLATWAATTCWALVAYLGCVACPVRGHRAAGRLGRAAVVAGRGRRREPAGVLRARIRRRGAAAPAGSPRRWSRRRVPRARNQRCSSSTATSRPGRSRRWSPVPGNSGPDQGVATFYRYLPDLPIAQVMFLAGLTAALLGVLGLPAGSGGRWLRRSAAAVTAAGLLAAGTAVALAGTGRLDAHGMIAIPAPAQRGRRPSRPLHARLQRTPRSRSACTPPTPSTCPPWRPPSNRCSAKLAGLPGAPVRISQAAAIYRQGPGNGVGIREPARP